jgi:hypothetical protein
MYTKIVHKWTYLMVFFSPSAKQETLGHGGHYSGAGPDQYG